jgi:hypothetical protein
MSIAHETIAKYREHSVFPVRMRKKYKSFFKFIKPLRIQRKIKLNRLKFIMVYLKRQNSYLYLDKLRDIKATINLKQLNGNYLSLYY